jgi:hypothetical protein
MNCKVQKCTCISETSIDGLRAYDTDSTEIILTDDEAENDDGEENEEEEVKSKGERGRGRLILMLQWKDLRESKGKKTLNF